MANQEELQKKLEEFRKQGYNVLSPTVQLFELSPLQELRFEIVQLNKDGGDAYKLPGQKKYGISAQGYERIKNAAGVIFDPNLTGRIPSAGPNIIAFRAAGAVKKPDGTYSGQSATYEIDLDQRRAETKKRLENAKNDDGDLRYGPEVVRDRLEDEMLRIQRFAPMIAETGAMGRVVRKITGMKSVYTEEELNHPFVVPKVDLNTSYLLGDPAARAMLIEQAIHAGTSIFGSSAPRQINAPPQRVEYATITDSSEEPEPLPQSTGTQTTPHTPLPLQTSEHAAEGEPKEKKPLPEFKTRQELQDYFVPMPPEDQWRVLEEYLKVHKKKWELKEKFLDIPKERQFAGLVYYLLPEGAQ